MFPFNDSFKHNALLQEIWHQRHHSLWGKLQIPVLWRNMHKTVFFFETSQMSSHQYLAKAEVSCVLLLSIFFVVCLHVAGWNCQQDSSHIVLSTTFSWRKEMWLTILTYFNDSWVFVHAFSVFSLLEAKVHHLVCLVQLLIFGVSLSTSPSQKQTTWICGWIATSPMNWSSKFSNLFNLCNSQRSLINDHVSALIEDRVSLIQGVAKSTRRSLGFQ